MTRSTFSERQRQVSPRLGIDDVYAALVELLEGTLGIGRPRLGDHHGRRQRRHLRDDLASASVEIERQDDLSQPCGEQTRLAPRRAFLGGAPVKPIEASAADVG